MMLYFTIFNQVPEKSIHDIFNSIKRTVPEVHEELVEVLKLALEKIDHLPIVLPLKDIPLELHGRYSTQQVFSALGINNMEKLTSFREGVRYSKEYHMDLFFVTLKKSAKQFTQTTMYEDYAIDEEFFHWQSQSRTSITSKTGQRYVNQLNNGSRVLLFVREETNDENNKTQPYICLGLADYVSHHGSAPISIVYRLREKMPMKILRISNDFVEVG